VNNQQQLIAWINTHDCGVQPCAIVRNGSIVVRVAIDDGSLEETIVHTYSEARNALGY
jgi:hypothetical protein